MLDQADEAVRGALTRAIARLGHAPALGELAAALSRPTLAEAQALFRRHGLTGPFWHLG